MNNVHKETPQRGTSPVIGSLRLLALTVLFAVVCGLPDSLGALQALLNLMRGA